MTSKDYLNKEIEEVLNKYQNHDGTWIEAHKEATQALTNLFQEYSDKARLDELSKLQVYRDGLIASKDVSKRMEQLRSKLNSEEKK